ncbi:hypothetical protein ACFXGR_27250 [Streptomyces mirabilis]
MVKTPERIGEEADLAARRLLAEGPAAVRMVLCRTGSCPTPSSTR